MSDIDACGDNGKSPYPSPEMEAAARLASGVAHDLNNILSAILGFNELSMRKVSTDDPAYRFLAEVHTAANRASTLTRQLQAFGQKQMLKPQAVDLNEILERMNSRIRKVLGNRVDLIASPNPDAVRVQFDPLRFEEILLQMAIHARAAMPTGGTLTIRMEPAERDGKPEGLLSFQNSGERLDEETLSRMFEPFFSTRGLRRGTGLGLAAVYGTVLQSGGFIDVSRVAGNGTLYRIYIPRADAATLKSGV